MVHHVVLKLAKAFIPVQSLYRSIAAFSLLLKYAIEISLLSNGLSPFASSATRDSMTDLL